jgi:hypothetical protein
VAIQTALELRLGFVGLSPVSLDARTRAHLAELAWRAQVPLVLWAGALPGLPGVLAEALVRRLPRIRRLRLASTGPFAETETARRDLASAATPAGDDAAPAARSRWLPERACRRSHARRAGLVARPRPLRRRHCVDELVYLEPPA